MSLLQDALQQELLKEFAARDPESAGEMPVKEMKAALAEMSYEWLGLSRLQLATIMSLPAATPNPETGMVSYVKLVPPMAEVVRLSMGMRKQTDRAMAIAAASEGHKMQAFATVDPQTAADRLSEVRAVAVVPTRACMSPMTLLQCALQLRTVGAMQCRPEPWCAGVREGGRGRVRDAILRRGC